MKPSPAPVVSTAATGKLGMSWTLVGVMRVEPSRPRLSATSFRRSCQTALRTASAERSPVRKKSSSSLSLTMWARSRPSRMPALAVSASGHSGRRRLTS